MSTALFYVNVMLAEVGGNPRLEATDWPRNVFLLGARQDIYLIEIIYYEEYAARAQNKHAQLP